MKSKNTLTLLIVALVAVIGVVFYTTRDMGAGDIVESAVEKKTLRYLLCGDNILDIEKQIGSQFEDINLRIDDVPWGQCQDTVFTQVAAGDPPDFAYVGSRTLKTLAQQDAIVSLDMSSAELSTYYASIPNMVKFDGQIWGLPRAFSSKALFYNKDLFEQAGLDPNSPPTTWQELYDYAQAIQEKTDASGYGLAGKSFDSTMHQWVSWICQNNGYTHDDNGNITVNSPEVIEATEWYVKMQEVSQEGAIGWARDDFNKLFSTGTLGMFVSGPWGRNGLGDVNWGVAQLPAGLRGPSSSILVSDSIVIFKGTGNEEASLKMAKALTAPGPQAEYTVGNSFVPVRPGDHTEQIIQDDPTWAPFLAVIPNGCAEPSFTDYAGFQQVIYDVLQPALNGEKSVKDALDEAAVKLKPLL